MSNGLSFSDSDDRRNVVHAHAPQFRGLLRGLQAMRSLGAANAIQQSDKPEIIPVAIKRSLPLKPPASANVPDSSVASELKQGSLENFAARPRGKERQMTNRAVNPSVLARPPRGGRTELDATFYVWRKKYGGVGPSELRRLRQLEEENRKLKQRAGRWSRSTTRSSSFRTKRRC